jgi:peroxiredoxin
MGQSLTENRLFVVLLIASGLLNIGLAYKVHREQSLLRDLQGSGNHAHVLGATVKEIHAKGLDGKAATISFTKNEPPTILYIFRPTCGWCAKNLPNLQAMQRSTVARHFRLIGISIDEHDLKQYVEIEHFTFPVYSNVAPDERARLAMGGTPQTLMIADGVVVRNWEGAYTPDLQKEIESTLGIKLPGMNATPPSEHL